MPQPPPWKRVLATALQFVQFRRGRQFTADVIAQTHQARDRLGTVIGELVAAGRHRNAELSRIARSGADRQLAGLGLVTKTDLVAFEHRMRPTPAKNNAPPKKRATTTRDGARKSAPVSTAKRAR